MRSQPRAGCCWRLTAATPRERPQLSRASSPMSRCASSATRRSGCSRWSRTRRKHSRWSCALCSSTSNCDPPWVWWRLIGVAATIGLLSVLIFNSSYSAGGKCFVQSLVVVKADPLEDLVLDELEAGVAAAVDELVLEGSDPRFGHRVDAL